jgi:flagellar hook assembly protein FlgD
MGMSFVFSSNTATTTINTGGATSSTVTGGSNTTALKDRLTTGSVLVAPNVIDLSRPGSAISLVVKSNKSADEVVIYDEEGNAVRTVTVSIGADGKGFVAFDGLADNDKKLSPGIYWVLLKGAPAGEKKRFIVVPKKK